MKKIVIIFYFFLQIFIFSVKAQLLQKENLHYNDFNFIIHLAKNKLFTEAEKEKAILFADETLNPLYLDSVNYFIGLEYYNEKKMQEAKQLFLKVSDNVFFYYKARYLAGLIDTENSMIDSALCNYNTIVETSNTDLNELKQFEVAGIYLLKKKYKTFDSLTLNCNFKNTILKEELENLKKCAFIDKTIKRKSPLLAGCLSAVIPGLGKVYAGNNGQALASFLTCGLFGAIATENILRLGIKNPQTILFSGMFGLFYIGNIWGSAVSVQLVKTEKQFENKHNILVGLKLPISKFFN